MSKTEPARYEYWDKSRLDYQLFGKWAHAPPPKAGEARHERAAEMEPRTSLERKRLLSITHHSNVKIGATVCKTYYFNTELNKYFDQYPNYDSKTTTHMFTVSIVLRMC